MSSFALYSIGILVVIAGVLYICHIAHMPSNWTAGIAILLVGAGIVGAVNNTRQRDKN
jgi:uncharacterized membrane protein HdeD (DUF308 family)